MQNHLNALRQKLKCKEKSVFKLVGLNGVKTTQAMATYQHPADGSACG